MNSGIDGVDDSGDVAGTGQFSPKSVQDAAAFADGATSLLELAPQSDWTKVVTGKDLHGNDVGWGERIFSLAAIIPADKAVCAGAKAFKKCKKTIAEWNAARRAAKVAGTVLHHLLPQSKRLAPFFKRAGLNIEDFKIPLDKATHRLLPDGIHTGPSGESWNGVWNQFFENNPGATRQEILDQLAKMRNDFGI